MLNRKVFTPPCRKSVWKFIKQYTITDSTEQKSGSGRPTKVTPAILAIVEQKMVEDDETTAVQLHKLLTEKGHSISISTIMRARRELGWTFHGSAYCQLIRDVNKVYKFITKLANVCVHVAVVRPCLRNSGHDSHVFIIICKPSFCFLGSHGLSELVLSLLYEPY